MNLLTIHSYALLDVPKIHTDLLWDLTLLFSVLAVVYFGVIFFFRNKFTSKTKQISDRKRQLSPMISEFLFYDANSANEEDHKNYITLKIEIRDLIKDEFNHQILSDILIDLQKDLSGETLERLYKLFKDLGLHIKAFDKLRSYRWQVVSQGIMELTRMSVTESYGFITKFINDKRGTVRKQAELAAVSLEEKGIVHFLDTTRYQISEWQQLKLMDILRQKENFQPPRFKRWLTSNNKAVVLFALRLLKHYDQNDANAILIQLVRHKNKQIKEETISCIQKFGVVEALDTLKMVFWKSNVNSKILILDTISELGTEKDIEFLQNVESKSFNFVVKSKALSTILTLAPDSDMTLEDLEDTSDDSHSMTSDFIVSNDEESTQLEEEPMNGPASDSPETDIPEALPSELVVTAETNIEVEIPEVDSESIPETSLENKFLEEEQLKESEFDALDMEIPEDLPTEDMVMPEGIIELEISEVDSDSIPETSSENKNLEEEQLKESDFHALESEIPEDQPPEDIITAEPIIEFEIPEVESDKVPETPLENKSIKEETQTNNTDQPMKEEKKEKPVKESFSLSMEDLKNLEVISDEILYSLDLESLDQFLKDIPDLDDFVEIEKEEPIVKVKPDFNGLRLNKDRTAPNDDFYEDIFSIKDDCDKNILLDTIFDVGDEREIPILKQIVVNEDNIGIRDKALKILNGISDQNYWFSEEEGAVLEIEKIRDRCIFKPLFKNADVETKLVLLDQIGEIGDTKEYIFLKTLLSTENPILKKKIEQTIVLLEEHLNLVPAEIEEIRGESPRNKDGSKDKLIREPDEPVSPTGILTLDEEIPIEQLGNIYSVENFQNTKGKMPLDFCFLLDDLEISPSKSSDLLDMDFELGSLKEQSSTNKKHEEAKNNGATGTISFLDQILSLPSKIKDIFNG
ncbi:ring-infected erythrocyte surface antigen domain-containing protein [Sediminicola luteus]|uniref:HEAT repeat domain-containing protein n=1 Tax=Sediminicola luteus TaxID=319238 RepID=A0ABV2TVB2_9FLAO